ncbi:MAG: hypothetical protein GYA59_07480 [Chloroflexi bacterium]|nr:hypothetical protein [Chloroflexota bacterium]
MPTSWTNADSLIAISLGAAYTRVALFDVADGQYHLIATGAVANPAQAPLQGIANRVLQALEQIQSVTQRVLIDEHSRVIQPSRADGSGIDQVVITTSLAPQLRLVVLGLLEGTSLESARRLAAAAYANVVENIGLNDPRRPEAQIDAILQAEPDVILLSGGNDQGASRPVVKLAELITLVCRVLPQEKRPDVLYAGNATLAEKLGEILSKWTRVHVAPNLRPAPGEEHLGPALEVLNRAAWEIRCRQLEELRSLSALSTTPPLSAPWAMSRLVGLMSQGSDSRAAALGVDLGAGAASLAAAQEGELALEVYPCGLGYTLHRLAKEDQLEALLPWLPLPLTEDVLRDYLCQKSLYPASLPLSAEALAIEQAAARLILQQALATARSHWPHFPTWFGPVLASGGVLSQAPTPGQALLMLLDGLQPFGILEPLLDVNNLAAALGAAAGRNTILPIQVLDTQAFLRLGTVLCPNSTAKAGTSILKVRLETTTGATILREIRQGSLVQLPLQAGQEAQLHLELLQHTELNPAKRSVEQSYRIVGGACGAVIDARIRPLKLPTEEEARYELLRKWRQALGG